MRLLAIDPGPTQSAWVTWDFVNEVLIDFGIDPNDKVLDIIDPNYSIDYLAIEMIGHYGTGMPAGKTVFNTCIWIGRFIQKWELPWRCGYDLILRKAIVTTICGNARAKDSNVRQALIDRFGPPGVKKAPGMLYGVKKDIWQALALAVAWGDSYEQVCRQVKQLKSQP